MINYFNENIMLYELLKNYIHTLKWTELFDDAIKYLWEKNARIRIIWNKLFDNIKKLNKTNPEQSYNIWMLLYLMREKNN